MCPGSAAPCLSSFLPYSPPGIFSWNRGSQSWAPAPQCCPWLSDIWALKTNCSSPPPEAASPLFSPFSPHARVARASPLPSLCLPWVPLHSPSLSPCHTVPSPIVTFLTPVLWHKSLSCIQSSLLGKVQPSLLPLTVSVCLARHRSILFVVAPQFSPSRMVLFFRSVAVGQCLASCLVKLWPYGWLVFAQAFSALLCLDLHPDSLGLVGFNPSVACCGKIMLFWGQQQYSATTAVVPVCCSCKRRCKAFLHP